MNAEDKIKLNAMMDDYRDAVAKLAHASEEDLYYPMALTELAEEVTRIRAEMNAFIASL